MFKIIDKKSNCIIEIDFEKQIGVLHQNNTISGGKEIQITLSLKEKGKGRPKMEKAMKTRILKNKILVTNLPFTSKKPLQKPKSERAKWTDANIQFINSDTFKWRYYATLTRHRYMSADSARWYMEAFVKEYTNHINHLFYVVEKFSDINEGCHIHCFLDIDGNGGDKLLHSFWQKFTSAQREKSYAVTDIKEYNGKLGASHYLGAKINKTAVHWDLFSPQKSV